MNKIVLLASTLFFAACASNPRTATNGNSGSDRIPAGQGNQIFNFKVPAYGSPFFTGVLSECKFQNNTSVEPGFIDEVDGLVRVLVVDPLLGIACPLQLQVQNDADNSVKIGSLETIEATDKQAHCRYYFSSLKIGNLNCRSLNSPK